VPVSDVQPVCGKDTQWPSIVRGGGGGRNPGCAASFAVIVARSAAATNSGTASVGSLVGMIEPTKPADGLPARLLSRARHAQ
jgi:hypothetical protein